MSRQARPIVVGIDGHGSSRLALDWALHEAVRRRLPVHLLTARKPPLRGRGLPMAAALHDPESSRVLEVAAARVKAIAPTVPFSAQASHGGAAGLLIAASRNASLVVVGARERRQLAGVLLDSTSLEVAAHAACPVAVVRELPKSGTHGVVVGVDGSELSRDAVALGFFEAAERHVPLTVLHATSPANAWSGIAPIDPGTLQRAVDLEEHAVVLEAVEGWTDKYPEVELRRRVTHANAVEALVELSRVSELLLVGSRGRGGFAGLILGSVSRGLLRRSHCPVMVVRPGEIPLER